MKRLLLLAISFLFAITFAGCSSIDSSSLYSEDSSSMDGSDSFAESVDELNNHASHEKYDIPVYSEKELLFETNGLFFLGRDAGFYYGTNARLNEAGAILATYPTSAIRLNDNGSYYTIYETDSGYRLYLFFDKNNSFTTPVGFPVIIKRVLSFSDFSNLDIGDPIEVVEIIDPVATLHKKVITDVWELEVKGATYFAEQGYPCTSIHYLKDGLLRIEYDMLDNGALVVSKIELNEDYVLTDVLGNEIDYTIDEMDLPNW